MAELTLEESVRQILPTLPLPIQKFFEQRKLGETARILMERYALHVDQGAILERELMLLLLGLENPEQFAEALYAELPISKQTVQDIIADVNELVFVPLREQMRKGSAVEVKPSQTQSVAAQPPRPMVHVPPKPSSVEVKPPQKVMAVPEQTFAPGQRYSPPSHFHLVNKIPPSTGSPTSTGQKLLEDHEEQHIEFKKAPPPPTNLPGVIHHPPIPKPPFVPPMPPPPTASPKATQSTASTPIPKPIVPKAPYSSDPYREPIDEN